MSEETPELPQPEAPICPYCLDDPFRPQAIPFNTSNGVQLLVIFCDNCKKVINVNILVVPQPRVQPAPRILRPQ